jgi:5-formyltetrahydrofolate cyclo-ligase
MQLLYGRVEVEIAKRLLRRRAHRVRNALDVAFRDEAEARIHAHVQALPELAEPRTVLAYASIRSEVSTGALLDALAERGHTLVLPRVEADGSLTARMLEGVAPGFGGILEPSAPAIPWGSIEVALVPGVAFDRAGHRLGYGGGYFDRALVAFAGTAVGLAFRCQVVDEVPTSAHDVDIDVLVTEEGASRTEGVGRS